MKKLNLICLALLAMVAMASCVKEGPMGPAGPSGPAGNDGSVNVASYTLMVDSTDWRWDETSWRVDFDYPAINADVYNSGAVLVYMENKNTWRQIPMTFYYSDYDDDGNVVYYSSSLETSFYQGGVSVFWTENDFYDGYRPEPTRFRIVAISTTAFNAHRGLNYDDYEAVKAAFNLAD